MSEEVRENLLDDGEVGVRPEVLPAEVSVEVRVDGGADGRHDIVGLLMA